MHKYVEKLLNGRKVEWKRLGDEEFIEIANNARKPVKASLREAGEIPYYGANNIQDYVNGYTHNGEYVLIAEDGSASLENYSIQYVNGKFWANNHVHVIRTKSNKLITKFLYYYLQTFNFIPYLTGGDRTKLTKTKMIEIPFPIPPLDVQREIVRVLDNFTELTAELTAELSLRKKQYEYYRNKLLTFGDEVEWKELGEVLQPKGYIRGPFGSALKKEFFVSNGVPIYEQQHAIYNHRNFRYFVNEKKAKELRRFAVKPNDLIVSCSGTIGKLSIISEKDKIGIINQALLILRFDLTQVNIKYIKYYFECYPNLLLITSGGAIRNIAKRSIIEKIKIPIPPIEKQKEIVEILDKFDTLTNSITEGLPKEISLRQKQYEYYRDMLLNFSKGIGKK